jgi:hypothetical protein
MFHDDAELDAITVICVAARESYSPESRSAAIWDSAQSVVEKHGSEGAMKLVVALASIAADAWSVVVGRELGHLPSEQEMPVMLSEKEMLAMLQYWSWNCSCKSDPEADCWVHVPDTSCDTS